MTSASTAQSAGAGRAGSDRTTSGHPTADQVSDSVATGGGGVPVIVRRRLATVDARLDGGHAWLATMVVVAIAAILRFVGLSGPKGKIFDETYYAKDAYGLIDRGVEWNYKDNGPSYVVHPPLGKWLIGLGEWAFGYQDAESKISVPGHLMTTAPEFGWRFAAAVAGTLSVLLLVRIGRRMFRSTTLGCTAGLLLALDGFHLVLSRSAILDIFLLLFVLSAFGALVLDRDARRRRWARALDAGLDPSRPGRAGRPASTWRDWPWWRLLAGVLLGCACAVKWSGLYFVPAFALLVILWEVGVRRSAGVRHPWRDAILDELPWLLLAGVLMVGTYLATWSGWLLSDDGYYRLASRYPNAPLSDTPFIGALNNLWEYHKAAYGFHTHLDEPHKYQSWPWQWLLLGRPVAFYWSGDGNCGAAQCASEVLLLGTPLLWWSFLPALAALAWLGLARRDWRAGAILLSVAAGLLPWFWFALDGRTMFSFYAAPALPFLVLAVVYVLGAIISPAPAPVGATAAGPASEQDASDRRLVGGIIAGAYVLLVALCFGYFYPIFVGRLMPYADWSARMWLDGRWI
ncbi:phospholipid carrier-dependent glycosyltransferase [Micromonospora globispora]|uniref:Polyprenol-phosphate-mannose--protein mannosyltransferase n=1 Tax=Micromonospora globispora TaxID=1450148 RepID=A0A317JRB6_9ACTN|nr:phospholipid carrier-dependent glycosyltransferase [Micromonospora globispora]PWU43279.1 phospholipid carrier-dependent glycosyltransferase [Micromonospora globispora]PWU62246.1 phospholipid carrier-dependent glycosyltransferase [Micromonospora globispora]RQX00074.1 phospholipid carrier-dependent glycosyltransferase [Micromonospora globispora]